LGISCTRYRLNLQAYFNHHSSSSIWSADPMKLNTGDKLALLGVTLGWLIVGAVVTAAIYALVYW